MFVTKKAGQLADANALGGSSCLAELVVGA
jgi:hypothetical protein